MMSTCARSVRRRSCFNLVVGGELDEGYPEIESLEAAGARGPRPVHQDPRARLRG